MVSQLNLYAILDSIGLPAVVGGGELRIDDSLPVDNGVIQFDLHITQLLNGVFEKKGSMWALVKTEDLGLIYKATSGDMVSITLIDLKHSDVREYLASKDMLALLTAVTVKTDTPNWVVDIIK